MTIYSTNRIAYRKRSNLKKNSLGAMCFLILLCSCYSCKKFIAIPPPVNQLVPKTVFNNNSNATAAQLGLYYVMSNSNNFFYSTALLAGLSGDELHNYSTDLTQIGYYANNVNPAVERASDIWTPAYNYIYQANAIIEGLKNNSGVNPKVAQQLTGESEFIRAYCHFYLTNFFGDIPLVTTTDYQGNATIARSSQTSVYQQIIADLKDAQNKLNKNFVDASDTTATIASRIRPTYWAATALLARAYLYTGDYQNAFVNADLVIKNTTQFSLTTLDKVFLNNNQEAIWQLQPLGTSQDTQEGFGFVLTTTPGTGTSVSTTVSTQLLSVFEANDARKTNWVGSVTVGANTYLFPNKYKIRTASSNEYTTQLRLAEQYLIRAEAQAKGGGVGNGLNGAISDLNAIRTRANLPTYSGSTTDAAAIFTAIMHERQIEFFAEGGHRWFDLKRTGLINSVMGTPGNVTASKAGIWNTNWTLYPIPQTELNNDPNLSQNAGY